MSEPIKPIYLSNEDWVTVHLLALQAGGPLTAENQEYFLSEFLKTKESLGEA